MAVTAAIAALRSRGADPVRLRLVEALARRAACHQGATRHLLDARLQQLLAGSAKAFDSTAGLAATRPMPQPQPQSQSQSQSQPPRQTLATLLAHIARHSAAPGPATLAAGGANAPAPELKAVRDYRSTWARLHLQQRLTQALAQVPHNAGPLNTQRVLHQALAAMRDASPQYLARFMAQMEALLWLEQLNSGVAGLKKPRAARPSPSA